MSRFQATSAQPLDQDVIDQAMLWMVTLQSGISTEAERLACQQWRAQSLAHEMAWQRLTGLNRDIRESTHSLAPAGVRGLLHARTGSSRRTVLKGFAGLGIALATGLAVRERVLLPTLFSDYRTATGERQQLQVASGVGLTLDTHTALDARTTAHGVNLSLSLGRVLLTSSTTVPVIVATANGVIRPTPHARLIISHDLPGLPATQVQMLAGNASVELTQGDHFQVNTGQQVTFDRRVAAAPSPVTATDQAWVSGQLIADRMPLAQVIAQLNRYRPGLLRCDPTVAALQVSGAFSLDHPDASLDLLTRVLPVRVQRVFGYWATVVAA